MTNEYEYNFTQFSIQLTDGRSVGCNFTFVATNGNIVIYVEPELLPTLTTKTLLLELQNGLISLLLFFYDN